MSTVKWLVTHECGRLARWLRLMGYDTVWAKDVPLSALYQQAYNDQRIVVTRNRHVGASCLVRVIQLRSPLLEAQLQQLMQELDLVLDDARLLSRCDRCNVEVAPIERSQVNGQVPPYVYATQQQFTVCPSCQRIYWAATHWQRVRACLNRLKRTDA